MNELLGHSVVSSRMFALAMFGLVAWLLLLTRTGSASTQNKLVELCVLVVLASMWNLIAGYGGLPSVGQQAFVGLGAYGLIVFANGLGWNIFVAILPATVVATVIALPIGLLAFRLRGAYFAIGTWVIAEVARLLIVTNTGDVIRGGSGTSLDVSGYDPVARSQTTSLLSVLLLVAALSTIHAVVRSPMGLALQAVRDNEDGARSLGVDVYRTRLLIWIVAAMFTAAAGAINYLQALRVQPDGAFSVAKWTAPIIVMVVIGGLGTIEGPIIGALVWYWLQDYLTGGSGFVSMSTETYLVASGGMALLFATRLRGGLWGLAEKRVSNLQLFPVRRQLRIDESENAKPPAKSPLTSNPSKEQK